MVERLLKLKEVKFSQMLSTLLVLMSLGYLGAYLKFAGPRGFGGDFYAAMFTSGWWDGTGVFYGPVFVFERWLVNWIPAVATIQFFAVGSLVLIILSMLLTMRICKFVKKETLLILMVWTFNSYLYYSFSVVSNPELIQLFFLVLMWWGLTTKNYTVAWIALTIAALTKLVPFFLFPILLIFFSWTGLVSSVLIIFVAFVALSVGQSESVLSLVSQTIGIKTSTSAFNALPPQPDSEQFLGLSSAIARLLGMQIGQDFRYVTGISNLFILALYVLVFTVSFKVYKLKVFTKHHVLVAYVFALLMTLLPILHLSQVHRHTYLYITPVWIALRLVYIQDDSLVRSNKLLRQTTWLFIAYSILPIYFLDFINIDNLKGLHFGSDLITSIILITEPIWLNLVLLFSILFYGFARIKQISSFNQKLS
jgi:hypothetical protein